MSGAIRCDPEQVTALVDGALEADAAAAREAHLAECLPCRRLAEAERAVRARLRALPAPEPPAGLERRVRARLSEARRPRRRPLWLALPVAAAIVLAVWSRGLAPLVAWELARDHRHCFGLASLPAQVRSAEPAVVADWFGRQGTKLPALPASLGETRLAGARYCYLADVSAAAHLYYTGAPRPLSLFVLTHGVRFEDGYSTALGGRAVALVRVEGTVVGVVGDSPDDVDAAVARLRGITRMAELLVPSGR